MSELEAQQRVRRGEVAIDLEDRVTKKGTPPRPSESGDIRQLHTPGAQQERAAERAVGPGGPS